MSLLDIRNLTIRYGGAAGILEALSRVNLTMRDGEFVVAIGASGCGKTTLLSAIAGFLAPSEGEVLLNGRPIAGPGADRGVVFQRHALMPWLNVVENVGFGPKMRGVPAAERRRIALDKLALVGLAEFGDRMIYELSGGMQQRVGSARQPHPRAGPGTHLGGLAPDRKDGLLHHPQRGGGRVPGHTNHRHDATPWKDRSRVRARLRPALHRNPGRPGGEVRSGLHPRARGGAGLHSPSRARDVSDGTGMAEAAPVERPVGAPAPAPGERSNKVRVSRYATPGEGSSLLISSLSIGALVLLWWLATHLGWVRPLFLPKPEAIWVAVQQAVAGDLDNHTLWVHIGWSLLRVVSAFALAAVLGIPIGLAMGMSRMARGIFDPPIEFYRPLPPLAYLPLMIIWFGIGELSKVLLIFLACFAPVALAARAGVRSVSQEQINAALSMGASRLQVIRHVVLLSALPEILVGLRIGMGVGWTTLVAAEMVAATAGLGQMVLNASNFLRTDVVVMGIICIGLFAYAFEMAMRRLERWLVPWKGKV